MLEDRKINIHLTVAERFAKSLTKQLLVFAMMEGANILQEPLAEENQGKVLMTFVLGSWIGERDVWVASVKP